tara:strand:- start:82 stop:1857 length:1776 start_codon:yes stop_codon:yes gene_type:complete
MAVLKNKKEKMFYDSLEQIKTFDIWEISSHLAKTNRENHEEEKDIITERKVLTYNLNKGRLIHSSTSTNITEEINPFSEVEIEYIKERIIETNNPIVKSKYSHIIWNLTKHRSFALIALENYIESINIIKADRQKPNVISAILYISKNTKQKIEKVKFIVLENLEKDQTWLKTLYLSEILENNIFIDLELKKISNQLINWLDINDPLAYSTNKSLMESAILIQKKLNTSTDIYYEKLAKNEDLILAKHLDESNFIRIEAYGNKAVYYRKGNNSIESEKNFIQFNKLKQKVKLGTIDFKFDTDINDKINQYLTSCSKNILTLNTENILGYFAVNEDIIVNHAENIRVSTENMKSSIAFLFKTTNFDINSNYKNLSPEEKLNNKIFENYIIMNNIKCYSLFLKVFVDGIIIGKINYYEIIKFLEKHTWFGTKFKRTIALKDIDETTTWISYLSPGIHNLFSQFELSVLMNSNKINNFILCIDSLTLKFEGVLRDFILLSGGNTTKWLEGNIQEQLFSDLIDNPTISQYFNENDIELFKFTFMKKGKDLRNNIAHSFMNYSDYSLENAILVFFCFLRLGKYQIQKKLVANASSR